MMLMAMERHWPIHTENRKKMKSSWIISLNGHNSPKCSAVSYRNHFCTRAQRKPDAFRPCLDPNQCRQLIRFHLKLKSDYFLLLQFSFASMEPLTFIESSRVHGVILIRAQQFINFVIVQPCGCFASRLETTLLISVKIKHENNSININQKFNWNNGLTHLYNCDRFCILM